MSLPVAFSQIVFKNPFPTTGGDGSSSLQNAMTIIFGLLGVLSVVVIVYAGIKLSLSRGNPDAIGKLRSTLVYAAVGLVIAIGATGIIEFVLKRI